MATEMRVTLKSSDGRLFEMSEAVALQSQTIKSLIEELGSDSIIPLPNVAGKVLAKVIEYCRKHAEARKTSQEKAAEDDLKSWDALFVEVEQCILFGFIWAANYLNIKSLVDLTCQTVADMMKGKASEEILKMLNIKKDFSPEEEEEV